MPSVFEIAAKNYQESTPEDTKAAVGGSVFDVAESRMKGNVFDIAEQGGTKESSRSFVEESDVAGMEDAERPMIGQAIDRVTGALGASAVEVPAALATGALAYFPSSLAGSIAPIFGEDPDEWEQKVAEHLTYDPKLKESKDAMKPIHAIMEMAFKGAQVAGDKVRDETNDKNLGYATKKGIEGLIMATIGKVLGGVKAKVKPKVETKPLVSRESLAAELAETEGARKQEIVDTFPKRERPLEKLAKKEKDMFEEQFKAKETKPSEPVYEPKADVTRAGETTQPKIVSETPVESTKVTAKNQKISEFERPQELTPQQKDLVDWAKNEKFKAKEPDISYPSDVAPPGKAKSKPSSLVKDLDAPRTKKGLRPISNIIKDINEALGERGSVGKGKKTEGQKAAESRLKADIDSINSGKKIPGRKVGGVTRPFVWSNAAKIVQESPELQRRAIPEKGSGGGWVETPLRVFDELGPEMKELFFWQVKDATHKIARDLKEKHNPLVKKMFNGTTAKERARVTLYGIAQQKRGGEIVKRMGFETPELTLKEIKLYDSAREWFDKWHPIMVDTAKKSGTTIGKVENYIPFMHKESFLSKFGYDAFNADAAMMDNLYHSQVRTVPYKYAKARAKTGFMPVQLDLKKIVNDYSASSTRHQHLSPVISQLKETIRASGIEKTAPRSNAFLNNWLDFTANPILKSSFPRPVAKVLMRLNENAMFAVLSGSARSAEIQTSAVRGPLVEAGLKHTLDAIRENILEDVKAVKQGSATRAMQKSKVLLPRTYDALQYDFLQAVEGGKVRELHKIVAKAGMKPLSLLDMETAKVAWYASYKRATKDLKLSEKESIRYADDQVIRTQASGAPEDVAPIMRTVEGKTIGFLQTFAINEYQWLKKDILGIGNKTMTKADRLKKLSKFIVATSLINSFFEDVLGVNSPFPAPIHAYRDAKEQGLEGYDAAKQVGWEIVGAMPFLTALRYNTAPVGTPGLLAKQIIENRPIEFTGTVLGIPGTSQVKKSIRAANRKGTPYQIVVGKYLPKPKKQKKRKKIGGGMSGL